MNTRIEDCCEAELKRPGISRIIKGLEHQELRSREAAEKAESILSEITGDRFGGGGTEAQEECSSIDDRINLLLEAISKNNERANFACDGLMKYLGS